MKHASYVVVVSLLLATDRPTYAQQYSSEPDIRPSICANGAFGFVQAYEDELVTVEIELDGSYIGTYPDLYPKTDWWIVASTPFGWFHYDWGIQAWMPGFRASTQASVTPMGWFAVLESKLPPGQYELYFGIDLFPDDALSVPVYYESVRVSVLPGSRRSAGFVVPSVGNRFVQGETAN